MSDYGKRTDGTNKGAGYFGELKRPDGSVSTEISVGVDFDDGEHEIPTLVPTLSRKEINHLLGGGAPTDAIVGKAIEHARGRMKAGKGAFAEDGETFAPMPEETDEDKYIRAWEEAE